MITAAVGVLVGAGMQSAAMYIGHKQGTVSQWVTLRNVVEVCAMEKGYKGGGGGAGKSKRLWQ